MLMICRTRTAVELSATRRSADDRYYYETPAFDYAHTECNEYWLSDNRWLVTVNTKQLFFAYDDDKWICIAFRRTIDQPNRWLEVSCERQWGESCGSMLL